MGEMCVSRIDGDSRACGIELLRFADPEPAPMNDRRRRVRAKLSLPVRLFRADGSSIDTTTHNVSSEGFYCSTSVPFLVGEQIRCILALPTFDPTRRDDQIALECQVRVVWTELRGPVSYGFGCEIEQYRVIHAHFPGHLYNTAGTI